MKALMEELKKEIKKEVKEELKENIKELEKKMETKLDSSEFLSFDSRNMVQFNKLESDLNRKIRTELCIEINYYFI